MLSGLTTPTGWGECCNDDDDDDNGDDGEMEHRQRHSKYVLFASSCLLNIS